MFQFGSALAGLAVFSSHAQLAAGHGYTIEPPARNIQSGGKNGNCPHCGNGNGICGDGNQWPAGSNYYLAVQEPQRTYTAGQIVELDISMNVNHMGHHEFFICDRAISSDTADDIACLQKWPLMRVPPEELGLECTVNDPREDCQPIDPNYPGRWYHNIPGLSRHKVHYRIPAGLSCSRCTMQWFWPTSNSAPYDVPSYSCFAKQLKAAGWSVNFCGWACSDSKCPVPYAANPSEPRAPDPAKTSGFEEFRNCADIRVLAGGPTSAPTPAPPTPGAVPTRAPTRAPTPPPTPQQSGGSCSGEPCADSSMCRSQWGYCGSSADYCNDKSTWKASGCGGATTPTQPPTPAPTPAQTAVPTAPAPTPMPTTAAASCIPIGDCGAYDWCEQDLLVEYCRDSADGGSCAEPFCMVQTASPGTRRLRVASR